MYINVFGNLERSDISAIAEMIKNMISYVSQQGLEKLDYEMLDKFVDDCCDEIGL